MKLSFSLDKISRTLTPSQADREKEKGLINDILETIKSLPEASEVEPVLVGSIAKDTDLHSSKDIDVFLLFNKSVSRESLERKGLDIGKKTFQKLGSEWELAYSEHPYTKGNYRGFILEIVPCYRIKYGESIQSAVDRSPLHTKYVIERLSEEPKLKTEIRLFKQFMKANGLYGANAAVEGFSGYLCELLILYYGSFSKTVEAIGSWEENETLRLDPDMPKNASFQEPLIVIDPVDYNRNVAAAVSIENMAKSVVVARRFLDNPSKEFFVFKEPKPMSKAQFKRNQQQRGTELAVVMFPVPEMLEDTLVSQLNKSLKSLAKHVVEKDFRISKKGMCTDGRNAFLILEMEVSKLPDIEVKTGPRFDSSKQNRDGFLQKNKPNALGSPYIKNDRFAIDVKRKYREIHAYLKHFMSRPLGFGKNIRENKEFKIYCANRVTEIKNETFWKYMSTFWD